MAGIDDDQTIIFTNITQELAQAEEQAKGKHACLLAIGGELNHTVFELMPGVTTIGRASDVTFCLEFKGVSRHHFTIEIDQHTDAATIADLGSRNGTYLNNKRLESKEILKKGDVIKMGIVALQYIPPGDPERLTFDKLSMEANTDALTRCFNKIYLNQATDAAVKKAKFSGSSLSLVVFDIDLFKKANDSFGQQGGDYILAEMAELIGQNGVREGDVYARCGGEKFAILLPATDLAHSLKIAEKIRKMVEDHAFRYDFRKWPITISVGVAEVRDDVNTGSMLQQLADQGVRLSKEKGRNLVSSVQSAATN
jgi:two-component system, cell cycle response regulator